MKKLIYFLLILVCVLSLTTCQTVSTILQEPKVSLHSVEFAGINFNGLQLLCKIDVQNPNGFEIPFPETDWALFLNANPFINGTVRNNNRIGARRSTIIEIPVNLDYIGIFNSFMSLRGNSQVGFRTAFALKFNLPVLGERIFRLEHNGSLPLPQVPRITAPSMRIDRVDISGAEIVVSLNINNPNVFSLPAPIITYNYMVNRNSFINGRVDDTPLGASSNTPINFRMFVNYADLFRSFASLITAREVATALNLNCDFNVPVFRTDALNLELAGTLPLR